VLKSVLVVEQNINTWGVTESPGLRILKRAQVVEGVWSTQPSARGSDGEETKDVQNRRRRDGVD
jgi:hypothetical protein